MTRDGAPPNLKTTRCPKCGAQIRYTDFRAHELWCPTCFHGPFQVKT